MSVFRKCRRHGCDMKGRKPGEAGYWITANGELGKGGRKVVSLRIYYSPAEAAPAKPEAPVGKLTPKMGHHMIMALEGQVNDFATTGHSPYYDLARNTLAKLGSLKKTSPEYRAALEEYAVARDAIQAKVLGQVLATMDGPGPKDKIQILDAELAKVLTNLLFMQSRNTAAISFLSPDEDHLVRVGNSAKLLVQNQELASALKDKNMFGDNYQKVVAMAVLVSKVGFGDHKLDPLNKDSYFKNRLFAVQMLDQQLKPMLMKELGLTEKAYSLFREAILREGTYGLGTGESKASIDLAIAEAKKLGIDIRDAYYETNAQGEYTDKLKPKYDNPLTATLTIASETDVSQQRLQPWQTNETLMKALVSISTDPLIQELYLEKQALDLNLTNKSEAEIKDFNDRFRSALKTVVSREITGKSKVFVKKLTDELRLKGMEKGDAEREANHLYGIIERNMSAISGDSYLWFLGSYGIENVKVNERGEIVIITPADLFATLGSAANLPHVRDFHKDRLTSIISQVNRTRGTHLTLMEEASRKNNALFQAAQAAPKADTHTHLKMSVDFDLYIWNGIILSTDMKTNEEFLKQLGKSDQLLTGLFVERQKKHGEPSADQKSKEIFELKKIFEIARSSTINLFNFVETQRQARGEPARKYDEVKNKDMILEDAKAELTRLEHDLDARIQKDGHSTETDGLRKEFEQHRKEIELYQHLKFFVQHAFNFQEGPLTEFVPHFIAASSLLNISEADKIGTLKRITKGVISNYQKDNVTYFEPRFNIGSKGETQTEVVAVIEAYKEWITDEKKKNPNAMIPEMKIILSITKFADQKKPYHEREQHKTESMQAFIDILQDARRGVASGDKPYDGFSIKPSEVLKFLSGIDSAGQEEFNPPSMYFNAFRLIENYNAAVRAEGQPEHAIGMTFHVSESNTDVSTESALRHSLDAIYMKPFSEVGPDSKPLMSRLGHSIVPGIGDFSSLKGTQATERVAERLRQIDLDLKLLEQGVPLQSVTKDGLEKERNELTSRNKTVHQQETNEVRLPVYDDARINDLELRAAFIRDEMIRQGIVVETNPTSNLGISPYITGYQNHTSKTYLGYQYGGWARDIIKASEGKTFKPGSQEQKAYDAAVAYLAKPEAKQFEGKRVRITINTDDLTLFGTNMTEEFYRMAVSLGLTADQLKALIEEGHKAPIRPDKPSVQAVPVAKPTPPPDAPPPNAPPVVPIDSARKKPADVTARLDPNKTAPIAVAAEVAPKTADRPKGDVTQPLGKADPDTRTQTVGPATAPIVEVSKLPPPPEMPDATAAPKAAEAPAFMATGWFEKVGMQLEPGQSVILNSDKLGLTAGGKGAWEMQVVCRLSPEGEKVYWAYDLSGNLKVKLPGQKEFTSIDSRDGVSLQVGSYLKLGDLEWGFGFAKSGRGMRVQYLLDKAELADQVNYYAGGPARTALDRLAALDPKKLPDPNEPDISLQEKNKREEALKWHQEAVSFKEKFVAIEKRQNEFNERMDQYRDNMIKDPSNVGERAKERSGREAEWRQLQADWKSLEQDWYFKQESAYQEAIGLIDLHLASAKPPNKDGRIRIIPIDSGKPSKPDGEKSVALASVYSIVGYGKIHYLSADEIGNRQIAALNSGAVKNTRFGKIELEANNLAIAGGILFQLDALPNVKFLIKSKATAGQPMAERWMSVSADGKTATAQIVVSEKGYTHSMEVTIHLKEAATKPAEQKPIDKEPAVAIAAAPKKAAPEAERTSGKPTAESKPERPTDYFESISENVTGPNLRGGLLMPFSGSPELNVGSTWKVISIKGDTITLGDGQRLSRDKSPEAIPEQAVVKIKIGSKLKVGESVQFVPPIAGGSGDAPQAAPANQSWVPGVLHADGNFTSGAFLMRIKLDPSQKWEDIPYMTAYNQMTVSEVNLSAGKIVMQRPGAKAPVEFNFDAKQPPPLAQQLKVGDTMAVLHGGGGSGVVGWVKAKLNITPDPIKLFEEATSDPKEINRAVAAQKLVDLAKSSPGKFDQALVVDLLLRGTTGELWMAQVIQPLLQDEAAHPEGPQIVTPLLKAGVNHIDYRIQQQAFNFLLQMEGSAATHLLIDGFDTALVYRHQAKLKADKAQTSYRDNPRLELSERNDFVKDMRLNFNMRALETLPVGMFTIVGSHRYINCWVDRKSGLILHTDYDQKPNDASLFNMRVEMLNNVIAKVVINDGKIDRKPFEALVGKSPQTHRFMGSSRTEAPPVAAPVVPKPRGTMVVDLAESGPLTFGRGKSGPGRYHLPSREISRDHVKIGLGERNGVNGVYVTSLVPANHFNGESYGVWVEGTQGWESRPIASGETVFVPGGKQIGLGIIHPKAGESAGKDAIVMTPDSTGKIYTESQFIDQAAPAPLPMDIAAERRAPSKADIAMEDMPTTVMPISVNQAYAGAARPSGIDPVVKPQNSQTVPALAEHLAALKKAGTPVNAVDEGNLKLCLGDGFTTALTRADVGASHTWIYALVDIHTGAILKFSEPAAQSEPQLGHVAVPIAVDWANKKLHVDVIAIANVGLTPGALQRMSNLKGFTVVR